MKKLLLAALMLVATPALADYQLKDNLAATYTMHANCDPSSGPCAPQVGGFTFGPQMVQVAIPAGGTHAAGSAVGASASGSLGALITVPVGRTNGGGFQITGMYVISAGGDTNPLAYRIWKRSPTTGTTCNNDATFVSNETDDSYQLIAPDVFNPVAPISGSGTDSKTYYTKTGLLWAGKNLDGTASTNVYVCIVTTVTDTVNSGHNIWIGFSGVDD